MDRIRRLEHDVRALYDAKNPDREHWADWLAAHHVFVVADFASELAGRFGADEDLARAAAMLHDIADVHMSRFDPSHEETSLDIARELLAQNGYTKDEIALIVDDAIKWHSCHDGKMPHSLEGKILSTADALAHLTTDFYLYALHAHADQSLEDAKTWTLKKLERDYHSKIQFEEIRQETKPDYEAIKRIFTR